MTKKTIQVLAAVVVGLVLLLVVLESGEDLDGVMGKLRYFAGVALPVVDSLRGMKVIGVIFASSVVGAYNDAVEQARAEERGDS